MEFVAPSVFSVGNGIRGETLAPVINFGPNQILGGTAVAEGAGVFDPISLWFKAGSATMLDNQTAPAWGENPAFLLGTVTNQASQIRHTNLAVNPGEQYQFEFDCITLPTGSAPRFAVIRSFSSFEVFPSTPYGLGHVSTGLFTVDGGTTAMAVYIEYLGTDAGASWYIDNVQFRKVL